jgi:hypothetical protein
MLRNVLIHAVVALAALNATGFANPVHAVVPVPTGAASAGVSGAHPAWAIVAYPEGEVLVFAPAGAGNE